VLPESIIGVGVLLCVEQEVNELRSALAKGVVSSKQLEVMHMRQLELIRREDESKLREAERENEQLRVELDALIGGAKRSDIGLVRLLPSLYTFKVLSKMHSVQNRPRVPKLFMIFKKNTMQKFNNN
jgi:hypothetical protein